MFVVLGVQSLLCLPIEGNCNVRILHVVVTWTRVDLGTPFIKIMLLSCSFVFAHAIVDNKYNAHQLTYLSFVMLQNPS